MQFSEHAVLYDMLIPQDHLLRKINDLIDFQFVLDELKSKYCQVNDRPELLRGGFSRVECINPPGLTLEEAMKNDVAQQHIRSTLLRLLSTF